MLERHHLKLLLALEEEGSLTAAAEALHLTQSALSHSVRKLESALGMKVWEKSGRQLRLTQTGRYLLQLAQELEPRFAEAEMALRAYSEGRKGKLRIGMECHPCYEWLMSVVPPWLEAWPDVDIDVIQEFRFDGLSALAQRHVDILITSDPLYREGLLNIPVLDYELLLVVQAVSRGASLPRFIKPRALVDQVLYTFPVEKARLDVFTHFLLPANLEPREHHRIETIEVMLQLVASGRGVCTLPDWLLEKYQKSWRVQGLRLGPEGVNKQLYLVLRESDAHTRYIADFIRRAENA